MGGWSSEWGIKWVGDQVGVWPKCVYVCVWPKYVQGSSRWVVKWKGVKWMCGPSVCVWSKCVAKVYVCVA